MLLPSAVLLNFFDNQWPSKPCDDERDISDGGGINSPPVVPAEDSVNADPSTSVESFASTSSKSTNISDDIIFDPSTEQLGNIIAEGGAGDEDAALYDDENISEGEGLDLYNLDLLFQNDSNNRTNEGQSVRRSSRKSSMPSKYNDFVVDGKVRYGINQVVNYSNLSVDA
ncbi:hypothetical protein Tco_1156809 [Tanacetum coccineum]